MAKKKRIANTPNSRAKEAKDFKQEEEGDEDIDDEPEKELSKMPSSPELVPEKPAEASADATDLVSARDKLKNLLQDLIEQSDDSLEDSAPAAAEPPPPPPEVTPKAVIKKESKKESEGKGPIGRRKRRRMQIKDTAFHHTYVMKLFDRSVDLAQFKVHTPLYPICRAWMANQPRNTNLGAKRSPTPEPEPEEEEEATDKKEEGDGEKEVVKKTYKMPVPQPLPKDPEARLRLKIPFVEKHVPQEVDMEMELKPSKEALLREHLDRWADVRRSWHATGHKNEERFAESAAILRAIFKRAQSQEAE